VSDPAAFVTAQTRIGNPSLIPEIRLHLADEVTPLWEATEATLTQIGLPPPYWAFAWPGGQALARHVLDHPELVRDRRVLDFAAGCGVGAIAAMRAGADACVATEIDRFALAALRLNAELNSVVLETLNTESPSGRWDVVLAGDVFYERPMAVAVEPFLRACARDGARVLVADPGRAYLPKTGLREVARYDVPTSLDLEDRDVRTTVVYEMGP
jgi:predicted nicotinamide N-methyase